ncbi:MAG: tRNA pseudouridine(55) synthase TruB [bacterium]
MLILSKKNTFKFFEMIEIARENGIFLLVDKIKDWTSFDVVAKIRGLTHIKKIGHAGTLDPLATGLLIVALGRKATKEIDTFRGLSKTYIAEIKLGATTITDDAEGEEIITNYELLITNDSQKTEAGSRNLITNYELRITKDSIENVVGKFIGKIEQIPPVFSAQKIDGKPAYKSARKNKEVILRPKSVEIYSIEIKKLSFPFITLEVNCSMGTYIRSLARDIGKELGCGAYLYNLRRTKIGDFSVEDALTIDEIIQLADGRLKSQKSLVGSEQ